MNSPTRVSITILLCSFWISLSLFGPRVIIAQKYHKEVFLEIPVKIAPEGGFILGPQSIGVDFEDHLCILKGPTLYFYNDEGEIIREFTYKDPGRLGRSYGFQDFCFDEAGNIYFVKNMNGEIFIHKSNPEGQIVGKMENDPRLQNSQPDGIHYRGKKIGFFPESGLFLFHVWNQIPITFVDEKIPDLITDDKIEERLHLAGGKYMFFEYINMAHRKIEVQMDDGGIKTLHIQSEENANVYPKNVYSYDESYQYYIMVKDVAPNRYTREIRKFNGAEFVYSTGEIPPNHTTYSGKKAVIDSRGTIYYYAGCDDEIQIFRWQLH